MGTQATVDGSSENHLYSIVLEDGSKPVQLTKSDDDNYKYYTASVSNDGLNYVLTKAGPGIPKTELINLSNNDGNTLLEDNDALLKATESIKMPKIEIEKMTVNGDGMFDMIYIYIW